MPLSNRRFDWKLSPLGSSNRNWRNARNCRNIIKVVSSRFKHATDARTVHADTHTHDSSKSIFVAPFCFFQSNVFSFITQNQASTKIFTERSSKIGAVTTMNHRTKHERREGCEGCCEEGKDPSSWPATTTRTRGQRKYRRFSILTSTEDHFRINSGEIPLYVGAFGNIRKKYLDYDNFHSHYRKERQWLHDSIIASYLENEDTPNEYYGGDALWFILTAGVRGAGKRFTMRSLIEQGKLLLTSYCNIDTDEILRLLPEFGKIMVEAPELVDACTGKEATYVAETLCCAALQLGRSVVWNGSLQYPQRIAQHIHRLRDAFPQVQVAVLHITAPSLEVIQERLEQKGEATGRYFFQDDIEFIEDEVERIQKAVEIVHAEADYVATICNKPDGLDIVDDQNWEGFVRTFAQYCRRKPPPSTPLSTWRGPRRNASHSFDVSKSTEDNYSSNDLCFYGKYANIRAMIDYTYHKNYTFERQRIQDSILHDFLQKVSITDKDGYVCTTPTEPWVVFTAGPMGAGKSFTMRHLVDTGRFPLMAFVNVDPDELRRLLPEYHLYALEPEAAGELTRKEAGFLAEMLTLAGLQAGKNVLVDGSLRDSDWYSKYFPRLRAEFPILRLAIIQVRSRTHTIGPMFCGYWC